MKIEIERSGVVLIAADVADGWSDLNCEQWLAVMNYISGKRKRLSYEKFLLWRMRSLIKPFLPKSDRVALDALDVIALGDIVIGMGWMTDTPPKYYQSFYRGYLFWSGPKEKLAGAVLKEYLLVQQFIQLWANGVKSGDEKMIRTGLNGVWAAGMRMRGFGWSNFFADVNMKLAKLVPIRQKLFALYNWWGLTLWLRELYPEVFEPDDDDAGNIQVSGPRALLVNLAGEKFGSVKNVNKANLHDAMTYMRMCAVERINFKRNQK